jgi:hypothetical protein
MLLDALLFCIIAFVIAMAVSLVVALIIKGIAAFVRNREAKTGAATPKS